MVHRSRSLGSIGLGALQYGILTRNADLLYLPNASGANSERNVMAVTSF